jgi:hypothetical protein
LAAAAAESVASLDLGGGAADTAAAARRRPVPLVKRTVRCPCGRRVSHAVVEEGQDAPALACDGVCQLEGRRALLAGAFGVDPSRRTGASQRRNAVWSGALLDAARRQPVWVQAVEAELADFVADVAAKR